MGSGGFDAKGFDLEKQSFGGFDWK